METCKYCNDTGWIFQSPAEGGKALRCRCFFERQKTELLAQACIPARYIHCTLGNYEISGLHESQQTAHEMAYAFAEQYPTKTDTQGILFIGPCGVGKTHLAVGILRSLLDLYNIPVRFVDFRSMLHEMRATYNPGAVLTEQQVLEPIRAAKVLLLDELGAQKLSGWTLDTLMYLLNDRYNRMATTIITTNYLDVPSKMGDESLEDRIGVRLRSRLFEMCRTVLIDGDDFRRRRTQQTILSRRKRAEKGFNYHDKRRKER